MQLLIENAVSSDATSKSASASGPEKPKRQRKKKEVGPDGKPIADDKPKEKKPRKPREPKDPNKPAAPRKKQKTGEATEKVRSEILSHGGSITDCSIFSIRTC